jgi:DNA-binding MarR family transcriptional regulator
MTNPTYQSGLLFTQAHKAVRACIYAVLEQYELTPTSWAIIGATAQAPDGIRLSNIATAMGVKPPMISVMVEELMHKQLIRQIPHHRDGRVKLLTLTERGKGLAATIEDELDTEIQRLLRGMSMAEVAIFEKALRIILSNSQAVTPVILEK